MNHLSLCGCQNKKQVVWKIQLLLFFLYSKRTLSFSSSSCRNNNVETRIVSSVEHRSTSTVTGWSRRRSDMINNWIPTNSAVASSSSSSLFFALSSPEISTASSSNDVINENRNDHDNLGIDSSSSTVSNNSSSSIEKQVINSVIPETSPLLPHTYAGLVETNMKAKFRNKNIDRVVESWRLVDTGYEHYEYHGPKNVSHTESKCHQQCHSYVRGLSVRPYWDVDDKKNFPWAKKLSKKYNTIKNEFKKVTSNTKKLQSEGSSIWASALTEDAKAYGVGWKTLVLMDRGIWDPTNVNLFPKTAQIIQESGVPAVEIFFTNLQPNSNISPHSDFTNFVLTSHLGIDIPDNGKNKCRITIGDETREWLNGQLMVFDTSLLHDAVNESNGDRFILMMRIWHPDLTRDEQNALQYTYDSLMVPELVTSPPGSIERDIAEQHTKEIHEFPEIVNTRGTTSNNGFGGSGGGSGGKKKKKKKGGGGKGFGA